MAVNRSKIALAAAALAMAAPMTAQAQTWVAPRTAPALTEIVAIDATGEVGWPYGAEDLVGDGIESFQQQEQSIDIRTAYASTDAQRFWVRVHVSDPNAVGGNITAFVFIDADLSLATGGSAAQTAIDPKLTTDPTMGGYDYVLAIRGNGSVDQIWSWQAAQMQFTGNAPTPTQATAETGQDQDPIQINGDAHGYLQASVELGLVGLTQACNANLFFRSVNASSMGDGDLEVGQIAPCVPADANDDGVPDLVVPVGGCTSDAQCPADGLCVGGQCVVATPCITDTDCRTDEQCSPDGRCIPRPAGPCQSNTDCGDLVCTAGTCTACTFGSTECGDGRRCGSGGRCVIDTNAGAGGGISLAPGEEVRGGAFTCAATSGSSGGSGGWPLGLLAGLAVPAAIAYRRRKR
jgi:hypothetical protein